MLVTHYYHPETGAPQTRLRETVAGLRRRGIKVEVIAPVPSYPLGRVPTGRAWWRPMRERIDGAPVARLPAAVLPGAATSRRLVGQATFAVASLSALAISSRYDVALIESPPLFLGLTARVLRVAGLPYVFHVADPWPDFPIAMGHLRCGVSRRLAFALEDLAYSGAAAITTVSPALVALLEGKPSAAGHVALLPNGVACGGFDPRADALGARGRLGWSDGFTVVYAGTVGRAQGIATLLEAATKLGGDVRIRVVGEGVEKADLVARARTLALGNVTFEPAVPRADVPSLLAAADAGLVLLRRGSLYDGSLPTKLLEVMAAGRPVIAGADGLTAELVREAGAGYLARAEDPGDLARAIDACRRDPGRAARGAAGRAFVVERFDREAIVDRLAALLEAAARGRSRQPRSARAVRSRIRRSSASDRRSR